MGGHDEAGYSGEEGAEYRCFIDQFRAVQNMFSALSGKAFDRRLRRQPASCRTTFGCLEIRLARSSSVQAVITADTEPEVDAFRKFRFSDLKRQLRGKLRQHNVAFHSYSTPRLSTVCTSQVDVLSFKRRVQLSVTTRPSTQHTSLDCIFDMGGLVPKTSVAPKGIPIDVSRET